MLASSLFRRSSLPAAQFRAKQPSRLQGQLEAQEALPGAEPGKASQEPHPALRPETREPGQLGQRHLAVQPRH